MRRIKLRSTYNYKQNAFTFLEVVIAISILAIITATTYSSLNQIIRAKKSLDDLSDGKAVADALLTRLIKELQSAQNQFPILPPKETPQRFIAGQPRLMAVKNTQLSVPTTNITFISPGDRQILPNGSRQADIVQISYYSVTDSNDPTNEKLILVREEVPYISPIEEAYKKSLIFPIAKDLISFDFLFFDENNNQWINLWPPPTGDRKRLPAMIQLLFRLRSPLGAIQSYSTIVFLPASGNVR